MDYYICTECGETFEEPHSYTESYGQTLYCCPSCGGGYVEAEFCHDCGRAFEKGDTDLIAGKYCKECLKEKIDYKTFLDFLDYVGKKENPFEISAVEQFFFSQVCLINYDDHPTASSPMLRSVAAKYNKNHINGCTVTSNPDLIEMINSNCAGFIFDCDLQDDFAEWLYNRE